MIGAIPRLLRIERTEISKPGRMATHRKITVLLLVDGDRAEEGRCSKGIFYPINQPFDSFFPGRELILILYEITGGLEWGKLVAILIGWI